MPGKALAGATSKRVLAATPACFIAEFSASQPGVCHRLVVDPEIVREVSLVPVADRLPSPAISAFAKAVMENDWQMALDAANRAAL
ncbi:MULTISPECIES: hypothetical protein [unclassified Mesorhizobium]|uniref:hypothetical protein n=1 Tax=unclassified Mesorhizobium TaxID=325217 RepID=UPI001FDEA93C|nr:MULTISPECIES: hypothetical protein [unclassified Mesorhizobium]